MQFTACRVQEGTHPVSVTCVRYAHVLECFSRNSVQPRSLCMRSGCVCVPHHDGGNCHAADCAVSRVLKKFQFMLIVEVKVAFQRAGAWREQFPACRLEQLMEGRRHKLQATQLRMRARTRACVSAFSFSSQRGSSRSAAAIR